MKTLLALGAALTAFTASIHADQPAIQWDGSQATWFSDDDGPWMIGFRFRTDSAITVTALGAYDYLGNGLVTSHAVGIWSLNGGDPLIAATVSSGTGASLLGQFRYVNISAFTLSANTEYVIGASDYYGDQNDIYAFDVRGFSVAAGISGVVHRELSTSPGAFLFPMDDHGASFPFVAGGNFQFVPVPEPSVYGLLSLGMGLVFLRSRYAKRTTA